MKNLWMAMLLICSASAQADGRTLDLKENPTTSARCQTNGFIIISHGIFERLWSSSREIRDVTAQEAHECDKRIKNAFANIPYWIIDYTFLKNRKPEYDTLYEEYKYKFTIAEFMTFLDLLAKDRSCQASGNELKALERQRDDITPNEFRRLSKAAEEKLIQACANLR